MLTSGCGGGTDPYPRIEAQLAGLGNRIDSLGLELETLKSDKSFDELMKGMEGVAYLTPGSDGYSVIRTDLGRLTVSLQDIRPYANGSRVTLQFGNITSATINGAKTTIEWGKVDPKGSPINSEAKSREITFTTSLRSGGWTNVSVVLEGVQPIELGFVRLRDMSHTGIRLTKY
jgi:hypothetical protein